MFYVASTPTRGPTYMTKTRSHITVAKAGSHYAEYARSHFIPLCKGTNQLLCFSSDRQASFATRMNVNGKLLSNSIAVSFLGGVCFDSNMDVQSYSGWKVAVSGSRFHCPIEQCSRRAGSLIHLKEHYRNVHLGLKSSICHVCHKSFALPWNLKLHIKAVHGRKDHECPTCAKRFALKSYLTRHRKVAHSGQPLPSRSSHIVVSQRTRSNTKILKESFFPRHSHESRSLSFLSPPAFAKQVRLDTQRKTGMRQFSFEVPSSCLHSLSCPSPLVVARNYRICARLRFFLLHLLHMHKCSRRPVRLLF